MTEISFALSVIAVVVSLVAALFALICLGVLAHRHPLPPAPKPNAHRVQSTHVLSGSSLEADER